MLTKQEVEYVRGDRRTVSPGRIMKDQPVYLDYAAALLTLFRDGIGKTRRELERGVEEILEKCDDCSLTRINAFTKLLIDVSTFETDRNKTAAKLRRKVWEVAVPLHPLSSSKEMGERSSLKLPATGRPNMSQPNGKPCACSAMPRSSWPYRRRPRKNTTIWAYR